MAYTLGQVKTDLAGSLHGNDVDSIVGVSDYSFFRRVAANVQAKLDIAATSRIALLSTPIHESIYDYAAPSDFKALIDLRPQVNRNLTDNVQSIGSRNFSLRKAIETGKVTFSERNDDGVRSFRISQQTSTSPVTLHQMDTVSGNGTWSVGADATNLTADTTNKVSPSASLNFDLDGSTTSGYIENSTFTSVDLTEHDEKSSLFVWVYFPDETAITNVMLRWGNDSSNYWSATATSPQDQSVFKKGWNLVQFDWNGATETGTVDPSAVDYVRVTITYDGTADTDFRVDKIMSSLGELYEVEYYSNALFRSTSGTFLQTPTADTDIVNIEEEFNNIFLYEALKLAAQQEMGADGVNDTVFSVGELQQLYSDYRSKFPSQRIKMRNYYYRN